MRETVHTGQVCRAVILFYETFILFAGVNVDDWESLFIIIIIIYNSAVFITFGISMIILYWALFLFYA